MAALGLSAHAHPGRALTAAALAVSLAACGVSGREDVVGRYVTGDGGGRETWSLAGDGSCEIARPTGVTRCEWELIDRDGRPMVSVTLLRDANDVARHRIRLLLTPSRLPGSVVTIPLPAGGELRKVE